jgi:hypothetical protein
VTLHQVCRLAFGLLTGIGVGIVAWMLLAAAKDAP